MAVWEGWFEEVFGDDGGGTGAISAPEQNGNSAEKAQVIEVVKQQFKLFPNPTKDEIMVDLRSYKGRQATINIFNPLGQLIKVSEHNELPDLLISYQLRDYPNGIYFMKVMIDGSEELSKEFVIHRSN